MVNPNDVKKFNTADITAKKNAATALSKSSGASATEKAAAAAAEAALQAILDAKPEEYDPAAFA